MSTSKQYKLMGVSAVPEHIRTLFPTIGNLAYDEKGQEIIAKLNERFRGNPNVSFEGIVLNGSITHLNNPRAIAIDNLLVELIEPETHVLTLQEDILYWGVIPERSSTYADKNAVSVGFKPGPNEELRQALIKDAGIFSPAETVIVSGLGIDAISDSRGFRYRKTDRTVVTPASELRALAEKAGIPFYCSDEGLGRVVRNRDGLDANWSDYLVYADEYGRVQVAQAPKARSAPSLEAIAQLESDAAKEKAAIDKRLGLARAFVIKGIPPSAW